MSERLGGTRVLLGAVVERFIARTPTAVAVRGAFEYALSPAALDALFETVVGPRDDRRLLSPPASI